MSVVLKVVQVAPPSILYCNRTKHVPAGRTTPDIVTLSPLTIVEEDKVQVIEAAARTTAGKDKLEANKTRIRRKDFVPLITDHATAYEKDIYSCCIASIKAFLHARNTCV